MTTGLQDEDYVYTLAGGATLGVIKDLRKMRTGLQASIAKTAEACGIEVHFNKEGYPVFDHAPADSAVESKLTGMALKLGRSLSSVFNSHYAQELAAEHAPFGETVTVEHPYKVETFAGKTVIACPPVAIKESASRDDAENWYTETASETVHYVPDGCTQIRYAEYLRLKADAVQAEPPHYPVRTVGLKL